MKTAILGLLGLFSLASCASIISGNKQTLTFHSDPSDAKITVNGTPGSSPSTLKLERWGKHKIETAKENYQTCQFTPSKTFNPWFLGNILLGGLIGMAIDLGTGAVVKYDFDEVKFVIYNDKPCEVLVKEGTGEKVRWITFAERDREIEKQAQR